MHGETSASHDADRRAARIRRALESALGVPFTNGNAIEILQNGEEIFPAMLDAIRGARERIEFVTFVYWTGDIAQRMAEALSERARAGVEVLVLLDGFGARPMNRELLDRMDEAGCRIRWFNPLPRLRAWQSDNRTHRKLLIVDGEVGFTGGVGIAAEWQGNGDRPEHWRDNHFRIRGPAVRGLRGGFYDDWMEAEETAGGALDALKELHVEGGLSMQVLVAQAAVGWSAIARLQDMLIRLAERYVRVQTPYFAPSGVQFDAVMDARRRGVEVEFMIPGPHTDLRISEYAGSDEIVAMLDAGCKLWRFQPTMLHSKLIAVDGEVATVGTANFNVRSVNKDNELAVTVLDRGFAARMDAIWQADKAQSLLDTPDQWHRRGVLRRVTETLSEPLKNES